MSRKSSAVSLNKTTKRDEQLGSCFVLNSVLSCYLRTSPKASSTRLIEKYLQENVSEINTKLVMLLFSSKSSHITLKKPPYNYKQIADGLTSLYR